MYREVNLRDDTQVAARVFEMAVEPETTVAPRMTQREHPSTQRAQFTTLYTEWGVPSTEGQHTGYEAFGRARPRMTLEPLIQVAERVFEMAVEPETYT